MGALSDLLRKRVYLDTNVIIYAVEGYKTHAAAIKAFLGGLTDGEILAVTSELTVAEVLVKPRRDKNTKLEEAYRRFLLPTESLRIGPVTRDVLEAAAGIRANTTLKLPDAIHVATAISEQCDSFLSNDERFTSVTGVSVILLSRLTPIE